MRFLNWSNFGRLTATAAFALAVVIGCESGAPSLTPTTQLPSSVTAALPDVPMAFAPGVTAERSNFIDVSSSIAAQDPTDAAFAVAGEDMAISVFSDPVSPNAKIAKTLTLTLAIAEGASSSPCSSGVGAGRFVVEVADDGSVVSMRPERPRLGAIVAAALRTGEVALCTKVEANFAGQILIKKTNIDLTFDGRPPVGSDDPGLVTGGPRGGGNNSNGNTADNSNGNLGDDNSNGNFDDDTNGNTGDDNANGNSGDDNTNGNTGDDNTNGNTGDDNTNGNTGDDNSNGNTGNDNTNTNGNSNDNSNTNGNSNDNSNGNTGGTGICPDGGTRLKGELDASVELEAEYRWASNGCSRFEIKVRSYAVGSYDILVNDGVVGSISVGGDGRGEVRLRTSDGSFPSDFPMMGIDDVVAVGGHSVVVGPDCSEDSCD